MDHGLEKQSRRPASVFFHGYGYNFPGVINSLCAFSGVGVYFDEKAPSPPSP
jgi:hypothetical protein